MARGAQQNATNIYNRAMNLSGEGQTNAGNIYSALFPALLGEATNPQGMTAPELAAENTAAQQSAGGATAGAVGEGNLAAARTRNAGGFAPALDQAARSGQRVLSNAALSVQNQNAALKNAQQQAGLEGLQGLYGTNTNEALSALGLGTGANNSLINAGQSGWFQNTLAGIQALSNALKQGGSGGSYTPL